MYAPTIHAEAPRGVSFSALPRLLSALGAALDAHHDYQRLQRLTDRQLDRAGLTREDLPRMVFERNFG